jgi:hypothetical protein
VDKFDRFTPGVLPGQPTATALQDAPQEGAVVTVDATGATFTLADLPDQLFGPAPWGLGAYVDSAAALTAGHAPQPGDRCLVVFAGIGIETPWIAGWWR